MQTSSVETALDRVDAIRQEFLKTRAFSESLCEPLEVEDYVVQTLPDVSPTRWHLAHTSWFFETFLLKRFVSEYQTCDPAFEYLFNSYYNQVGSQFPRPQRGWLSRPTVADVYQYRHQVDEQVVELLVSARQGPDFGKLLERVDQIVAIVELGIQHEQQHQELILMDLKHVFASNPLFPAYRESSVPGAGPAAAEKVAEANWVGFDFDRAEIGAQSNSFGFDNEYPKHEVLLRPFEIQDRLITNSEYLEFIEDEGYQRPELWLSLGWQTVGEKDWRAPAYWIHTEQQWHEFSLSGLKPIDPNQPVCHLSFFEADAFARWSNARLATEFEWEAVANQQESATGNCLEEEIPKGNFAESGIFHPVACHSMLNGKVTNGKVTNGKVTNGDVGTERGVNGYDCGSTRTSQTRFSMAEKQYEPSVGETCNQNKKLAPKLHQLMGDVWEWTSSPYVGYPGYRPPAGAIGEYNGKFMCNQIVLRGGACVTPRAHIRTSYRNFFAPESRWQFSGIRLAKDC